VFLEGQTLNPAEKDSVLTAVSHWIVELGELDATFKKADIAQLKAFVTKTSDKVRRPYALKDSSFPRRTVFAGTVNPRKS
jgi:putative DNA primase/helicase